MELTEILRERIRTIPDFPKPGIAFKDVTPVFQDPELMRRVIEALCASNQADGFDAVGGIEARGLILGAPVAHAYGKPFFPFRKPGKLPWKSLRESFKKEYGQDELEIHVDAIAPGARVLIVDDLLATGGTAAAAARLVRAAGGEIAGIAFLVELTFLAGRAVLHEAGVRDERIVSLVSFGMGE
jgi:adenine phosphoribosyltransferase